jgi:hypothetical protein
MLLLLSKADVAGVLWQGTPCAVASHSTGYMRGQDDRERRGLGALGGCVPVFALCWCTFLLIDIWWS